ncbi:hypothetical protein [Carboxylicivirga marina]|uniref:SH3 domain-containing protein n=1 Tax=Carboxylicivirga marina TaxID=2800988 RepID=A0ABS1HQT4_9BACT|nr:hypothetical protein [Carboxylicivirga marina]MBK3520053.1 hypothetical protein [Carboxylicivirga marina]
MKNSILYLLFLILLVLNPLQSIYGQQIDGPANCRDGINGEILYVLEDSTFIYAREPEDNWFKIRVDAHVDEKDYKNGHLVKGAKLYDINGKVIGVLQKDIETYLDKWYAGGKNYTAVHIESYTFKSNIRNSTILEREIERIVSIEDDYERNEELKELISLFGFQYHSVSDYSVFTYYEYDNQLTCDIRMFIYFDNHDLIGIAKGGRKLNIKSIDRGKIDYEFDIYYFFPLTENAKQQFVEKMDKYFLLRA